MTYSDADYLRFDPFEGGDRDVKIRVRKVRIVTTRSEQKCLPPEGGLHPIKSGTRARFESAIVDGEWGSYYTCLACMSKWLKGSGVRPIRGGHA